MGSGINNSKLQRDTEKKRGVMNLSSYPHLVKEWHPTKNRQLIPDDFSSS